MARGIELMEMLEGRWVGDGVGVYPPAVPRFQYVQELVFEKAVPFEPQHGVRCWRFRSILWSQETEEGLLSEVGFLRFSPVESSHGRLEMTVTAPSGLCEVNEGTYNEDSFDVWTRYNGLVRPTSAPRPFSTEVRRFCEIRPQNSPCTMEFRVEVATEETPMQTHLFSRLQKVDPEEEEATEKEKGAAPTT